MAASLSRPDPTSPASVAEAGFGTARRGYSQDEVRAFLTSVASELRRLQERERELEAELRAARASAPGRVELDDDTVANVLGEETLRVLQTARESAAQIKIKAEETAARVLHDSHEEANRLRQDAEVDAARRRQDAQSEAEAEVALAKQQGREMVNEARAYRERVLADLERRTKLARQHIEELAHGRERLLQVFERARLVAVDVTSELQAFAEPDEYVNLSPTTAPVPLMVPGAPRPSSTPTEPYDLDADEHNADTHDADTHDADTHDADEVGSSDASSEATVAASGDEVVDVADDDGVVAAAEPADATDVADGGEAVPDVDDADGDDTVAAPTDPEPDASGRDTNVVALFPREVQPSTEEDRPAVDDLFARLRSETAAEQDGTSDAEVAAPDDADDATDATDPVPSTPFGRRDEALVPLIVTAARKLKRILADEQNGVLDSLRRHEPVRELAAVLPEADAHLATYADAVADELAAAASAGACELGATDTASLRRTIAKAGGLDAARRLIRTELVTPLRDRLERSIVDGAGDNDDITRRVRAVYREWKTQHIDDQLDDVFRFAFGGGLAVSAAPGTPLQWTIDPTEPACADCEDNSLAGPVASGESYPTGHTMAPAHPGCRCLTLPVRH